MRPEHLAAYADGELDPGTRAAVERWLVDHPEAAGELLAQHQLSPSNWPFWQKAEPPLPSPAAWAAVRNGIVAAALNPPVTSSEPTRGRWRRVGVWVTGGCAAAAVAVAIGWVAVGPPAVDRGVSNPTPAAVPNPDVVEGPPTVPPAPEDPLTGLVVLPIASHADVEVQRVVGVGAVFPVGEPPLIGPVVLATEDDVEVEEFDNHPGWPLGGPVTVPARGDAPMIFATKSR